MAAHPDLDHGRNECLDASRNRAMGASGLTVFG